MPVANSEENRILKQKKARNALIMASGAFGVLLASHKDCTLHIFIFAI